LVPRYDFHTSIPDDGLRERLVWTPSRQSSHIRRQYKPRSTAQRAGPDITAGLTSSARTIALHHTLSARQLDLLLAGGVINWLRERLVAA